MAKLTLTDISNISGAESTAIANINSNSAAIEAALENTLSRDGTTPNQMNADLDMNSNDIINAGSVDAATLVLNGVIVGTSVFIPADGSVTAGAVPYDNTTSTLTATDVQAAIDEVVSEKLDATVTRGTTSRPLIQILRDTPPSIADFGGVGDGTANDRDAFRACLDTYGVCYLPYFQPGTYTPAIWYAGTEIVLSNGQQIIGDPRKPMVKQAAGDNLFVLQGNGNSIENLFVDQRLASIRDVRDATVVLDVASGSMVANRLKNITAGIDRDDATLLNGFDFLQDTAHATNKIVDFRCDDVKVFGAKGFPVYFTQLFASIYFDRLVVDWTRQIEVPALSGVTVIGGEGIFFNESAVQGIGSSGAAGNPLAHAFDLSGGRAIRLTDTYGDTVGGSAFKAANIDGLTMHGTRGSLCGEHQYDINNVTNLEMVDPYAGGRRGVAGGWNPAGKDGIRLTNVNDATIEATNTRHNTGNSIHLINSAGNTIGIGQAINNTGAGVMLTNSPRNTLDIGQASGNTGAGVELSSSPNNTVDVGQANSNAGGGVKLALSSYNTMGVKQATYNTGSGIELSSSQQNILNIGMTSLNSACGTKLISSPYNTIHVGQAANNTGAGVELNNSIVNQISAGIIANNGDYGVKETGTSNSNGVSAASFVTNVTSNGIFTGTSSYTNGIMPNGGTPTGFIIPGAVAW